jgi:thiamine biosynthesis lipoprotein
MTMGTYGNVTVVTADSAATDPVARIGLRAFTVVDSLMSNWSATSEISRLNRVAADGATAHPDVAEVLGVAREVWAGSGGAFDPTVEPLVRLWGFLGGVPEVPDSAAIEAVRSRVGFEHVSIRGDEVRYADPQVRVDLGGIAKGYGVDRAVAALREAGVENAMVDISGNLRVLGSPPGRDRWTVGIRDPRDRVSFFARLPISEEAVATSGTYEQFVSRDGKVYGHILDPRTGWPAEGLISVTVVTATGIQADAWGTALFVMGAAKARALVAHRDDLEAILVEPGDGDDTLDVVWVSAGLADRLALEKGMDRWFEIRSF